MTSPAETARRAILGIPYDPTKQPEPQGVVDAFVQQEALMNSAIEETTTNAQKAEAAAAIAVVAKDGALLAASGARYYPTVGEGLADTPVGDVFWTIEGSDIAYYLVVANLYDRSTRRDGYFVTNSGAISPSANWACTAFIPVVPGAKYTVWANSAKRHGLSFFTAPANSANISGSFVASASLPLTVTAPPGASHMAFNVKSPDQPEPSIVTAAGGEAPITSMAGGVTQIASIASEPSAQRSSSILVLAGEGGYVESSRSGASIKNTFVAFPAPSLLSYPCVFNVRETWLNGVSVRNGTDDVAPDHIWDTTVDANHGYILGTLTAAGHGKSAADQGSLWSNGGSEFVLVRVLDANRIVLARVASNTAPVTGNYTHVSGAVNTGSITATEAISGQWYPPHTNYKMRVLVDGVEVVEREASWSYRDSVQFIETYDVLAREEIITWWIANGGATGGLMPTGSPSIARTITYHYDRDGQLSIYQNWLFLRETPLNDLMGLQVGLIGSPAEFYLPGAVPFTYEGSAVDFSRKVPSSLTLSGPSINFNGARLQSEGEYGHRMLSLWADKVFAVGFLPVADADLIARRDHVSNRALELRGGTGKLYFRALDKGAITAVPGEFYSVVGYRHIVTRTADRTSSYVVRTEGAAYIYADWHNKSGLDRLPIPADLTGRSCEVLDSRNAQVKSGTMPGSLPVMVFAAGDYGYLVARVN